jgi:hypothetical protein
VRSSKVLPNSVRGAQAATTSQRKYQRLCLDHHSRTANSASAISGGLQGGISFLEQGSGRIQHRADAIGVNVTGHIDPDDASVRASLGAGGDAVDSCEPFIPADPVLVHTLRQGDPHNKMIAVVVKDVVGMADRDLRAWFDVSHAFRLGSTPTS